MKFTPVRLALFIVSSLLAIVLMVSMRNSLVYKEVPAETYREISSGYSYETKTDEQTTVEFRSSGAFVIECDGELQPAAEAYDMPQNQVFKFHQTIACKRFVVLYGYPTIRSGDALVGVNIFPFSQTFLAVICSIVLIFVLGACFFRLDLPEFD